jgi:uncharacterized protein YciI
MKHFIVIISFKVPIESIGEHLIRQHFEILQGGCELGHVLLYGPSEPEIGSIVVARVESREKLMEVLDSDPLWKHGLVSHEIREFIPVRYPATLQGWVDPLGFHHTEG